MRPIYLTLVHVYLIYLVYYTCPFLTTAKPNPGTLLHCNNPFIKSSIFLRISSSSNDFPIDIAREKIRKKTKVLIKNIIFSQMLFK